MSIDNKKINIVSDANFNNNKIVNAKIDASENEITGVVEELQAGNGISISGNTISLKGTTQLPDETDIDTITTEGNYFIDSPTSTYGLPDLPSYVMTSEYGEHQTNMGSVSKWLCLLLVEKQYGYGTYFVRQTITLTPVVSGYIQTVAADTLMFTRILSDSTYPAASVSPSWTKIDGDNTRLYFDEHVRSQPMTIDSLYGNYTYIIGFNSQYSITGLTLTNIENTPNEIQVIFKVTTNNFTLTAEQLQILNYNNFIFETGKTYILTIKNLYASIACNGEDINLKTFINKTIVENDLQKRLVAGNNVTITNYGWQGFSTTNNLELNTEHSDYVNLIKFNLNELNKNNTIFHSQYDDEHVTGTLNIYLEVNNENKLHAYFEYVTYNGLSGQYVKTNIDHVGNLVLQPNKYYWVMQRPEGFQPTLNYTYLIEDDDYTINSLPAISEWTQQFSMGTYSYEFKPSATYPSYIGYNPVNTNNYFSGVIQEFKTTNFNLSTAIEGTDFINNGCVNGAVISATGGGDSLPNLYDIKTLSQAIADKGWAFTCKSTRQDLSKADVPTVYEDIKNKYLNCDEQLGNATDLIGNSQAQCLDIDDEYLYTTDNIGGKLKKALLSNLPSLSFVDCGTVANVGNSNVSTTSVGNNVLINIESDNYIRIYKKSDMTVLKSIQISNDDSLCSVCPIFINGIRKICIVYKAPNDTYMSLCIVEDKETLQYENYMTQGYQIGQPAYVNGYFYFESLRHNDWQYLDFVRTSDFATFETQKTLEWTGTRDIQPTISNGEIIINGHNYISEDLGQTWTSSNTLYSLSLNYRTYSTDNTYFYFVTSENNSRFLRTTNLKNFTSITNLGRRFEGGKNCLSENKKMMFIQNTRYDNVYRVWYLGYENIVYTDTYIINGATVNIQYYKNEDWKICISDGGTNDTNLATIYSYLGYYNYYILDTTNETVSLPRNSNLYSAMYVGDNYQDTTDGISGNATRLLPQAEVISDSSASVSLDVKGNKDYQLINSALTSLTITTCEDSQLGTTIQFNSGATATTITDSTNIEWTDGAKPEPNASKTCLIFIWNNKGFYKEW
jgi:hypothetical protein